MPDAAPPWWRRYYTDSYQAWYYLRQQELAKQKALQEQQAKAQQAAIQQYTQYENKVKHVEPMNNEKIVAQKVVFFPDTLNALTGGKFTQDELRRIQLATAEERYEIVRDAEEKLAELRMEEERAKAEEEKNKKSINWPAKEGGPVSYGRWSDIKAAVKNWYEKLPGRIKTVIEPIVKEFTGKEIVTPEDWSRFKTELNIYIKEYNLGINTPMPTFPGTPDLTLKEATESAVISSEPVKATSTGNESWTEPYIGSKIAESDIIGQGINAVFNPAMERLKGPAKGSYLAALGLSALAFAKGIPEGFTALVRPSTYYGYYSLATNPQARAKIAEQYATNPLIWSETAGAFLGGYLFGKGVGKLIDVARGPRLSKYETIPKNEELKLNIINNRYLVADYVETGKAVKLGTFKAKPGMMTGYGRAVMKPEGMGLEYAGGKGWFRGAVNIFEGKGAFELMKVKGGKYVYKGRVVKPLEEAGAYFEPFSSGKTWVVQEGGRNIVWSKEGVASFMKDLGLSKAGGGEVTVVTTPTSGSQIGGGAGGAVSSVQTQTQQPTQGQSLGTESEVKVNIIPDVDVGDISMELNKQKNGQGISQTPKINPPEGSSQIPEIDLGEKGEKETGTQTPQINGGGNQATTTLTIQKPKTFRDEFTFDVYGALKERNKGFSTIATEAFDESMETPQQQIQPHFWHPTIYPHHYFTPITVIPKHKEKIIDIPIDIPGIKEVPVTAPIQEEKTFMRTPPPPSTPPPPPPPESSMESSPVIGFGFAPGMQGKKGRKVRRRREERINPWGLPFGAEFPDMFQTETKVKTKKRRRHRRVRKR